MLEALHEQLEGTMFSTVLVDREGKLTQLWCGDKGARRAFDNLGLDVGASMLEESMGTNALGTVLETRAKVVVHGEEHFAVPLRRFSCYGHPIFHPTTRRIEGVLDLSAMTKEASPLLHPLVARAVSDIEQRLLDRSRIADKELLAAFRIAGTRRRAVLAFGQDMMMANQAANDLLSSNDIALLRMLAQDVRSEAVVDVSLESSIAARVEVSRLGGSRGGALVHVDPQSRPQRHTRGDRKIPSPHPLLVSGPPGSGRSTAARSTPGDGPLAVLTAASATLDGSELWARNFSALLRAEQGTVCIDGIDLLPDNLLDLVASHATSGTAPRLVLVSGPVEGLSGRAAALASACTERVILTPLTARLRELPSLVRSLLTEVGADPSVTFTPGVMRALATQPWPGNLRELKAVVEHAVRRRPTGAVTINDLPDYYRTQETTRALAPIDAAERAVIVEALREHNGNKVRVAQALGISRTTLYAKMRTLQVTVY